MLATGLRCNMPEAYPDFQLRGVPQGVFGTSFPCTKTLPVADARAFPPGMPKPRAPGGDLGGRQAPATVIARDSLNFFTCFLLSWTKKHVRLGVGDAPMARLGSDWSFFGVPSGLLSHVPLLRRAVVPVFARSLDQIDYSSA